MRRVLQWRLWEARRCNDVAGCPLARGFCAGESRATVCLLCEVEGGGTSRGSRPCRCRMLAAAELERCIRDAPLWGASVANVACGLTMRPIARAMPRHFRLA